MHVQLYTELHAVKVLRLVCVCSASKEVGEAISTNYRDLDACKVAIRAAG